MNLLDLYRLLPAKAACLAAGIIGLLLSFSGCTDEFAEKTVWLRQEILLYGSIEQQNITRAGDAGFAAGDRMGVYVVDYQDGQPGTIALSGNRADNYALTLDAVSDRWTGNGAIYWKGR